MNTKNFSLTITSGNNSVSVNSDSASGVTRLMQLAGNAPEAMPGSLTVATDPSAMSGPIPIPEPVNNARDVQEILRLSGLGSQQSETKPCGCPLHSDCDCGSMQEDQARYDQNQPSEHRLPEDEQLALDPNSYTYQGRANQPERIVGPRSGSNPLQNDLAESIHQRLKRAYESFENDSTGEFDNSSGLASPLTSNNRESFDRDPFRDQDDATTDGSESPLSTVKRQKVSR
jgi:hypothetical protein